MITSPRRPELMAASANPAGEAGTSGYRSSSGKAAVTRRRARRLLVGDSSSGRASGTLLAAAEFNARQLTDEVLAQAHWMSKHVEELLDGLTGLPHAENRAESLSATPACLKRQERVASKQASARGYFNRLDRPDARSAGAGVVAMRE